MARIELRDCTIRIKDGFGGTAAVDDTDLDADDTTMEIDTVAGLTNSLTTVPVGARFTTAGIETVRTVTAVNNNEVVQIVIDATGGDFDVTFGGQTASAVAYGVTAAALETALEGLSSIGSGNVTVSEDVDDTYVIQFIGDLAGTDVGAVTTDPANLTGGNGTADVTVLHPGNTTWELTFTPAIASGSVPSDDDVITFLPQQIAVTIGEGNLSYTENKEYEYLTDRGDLDSVREGNQVPMDVVLDMVYEFITTGTSETITPTDALKGSGGASGWVSSSSDPCEPYAVDLEVEHDPPCGSAQSEITLFPDFRHDQLEVSLGDATISATGRCNAVQPVVTRES